MSTTRRFASSIRTSSIESELPGSACRINLPQRARLLIPTSRFKHRTCVWGNSSCTAPDRMCSFNRGLSFGEGQVPFWGISKRTFAMARKAEAKATPTLKIKAIVSSFQTGPRCLILEKTHLN